MFEYPKSAYEATRDIAHGVLHAAKLAVLSVAEKVDTFEANRINRPEDES